MESGWLLLAVAQFPSSSGDRQASGSGRPGCGAARLERLSPASSPQPAGREDSGSQCTRYSMTGAPTLFTSRPRRWLRAPPPPSAPSWAGSCTRGGSSSPRVRRRWPSRELVKRLRDIEPTKHSKARRRRAGAGTDRGVLTGGFALLVSGPCAMEVWPGSLGRGVQPFLGVLFVRGPGGRAAVRAGMERWWIACSKGSSRSQLTMHLQPV